MQIYAIKKDFFCFIMTKYATFVRKTILKEQFKKILLSQKL